MEKEEGTLPDEVDGEQAYNEVQPIEIEEDVEVAGEKEYASKAMMQPERQVELPQQVGGGNNPETLDERMEDMSDLTDQQAFLRELFPLNLGTPIQRAMMVARVSPDVFLPLLRIGVTNDIMMSDPEQQIDVNNMITKHYSLLSIGLDGKGRIDIAELSGATREEKQLQSGMGGIGSGV